MDQEYRNKTIDNIFTQLNKDRQDRLTLCNKHDKKLQLWIKPVMLYQVLLQLLVLQAWLY